MADNDRGQCKGCRYFDSHQAQPDEAEVARCMQPDLEAFDLSVSGASGCSAFEARAGLSRSPHMEAGEAASTLH